MRRTGDRANRSWPIIAAVLGACLLIFVVLPNPFRIPSNEPSAVAEFAPVPGKKEQSNRSGSFSATGFAEGGGFGALPPDAADGGPGSSRKPRKPKFQAGKDKPCYGKPPFQRQTEDPLSPPCVVWDGSDNGGATTQGVTRDEILVIFYNDAGIKGDMNTPYRAQDETGDQTDFNYRNLARTIKAQLRYHNSRYQTYGRTVHVISVPSTGGGAPFSTDQSRRGDANKIIDQYKPFAVVYLGDDAGPFWDVLAARKVAGFGINFNVPRAVYERNRPYMWSFIPDLETEIGYSASFICRKLVNRNARFAGDPALRSQKRVFGLIYETPLRTTDEGAAELKRQLKQQCGVTFGNREATYGTPSGGQVGQSHAEMKLAIARMKNEGVTTVICYCLPGLTAGVRDVMNGATAANYYPEWYWDSQSAMDRPIWMQRYAPKEQTGNFGVTYFWKVGAFKDQYHYRAYLEAEGQESVPNVRFNFTIYHLFQNLFSGVQGAGAFLDAGWAERGMFSFKVRNIDDASLPTGGYGPGGPSPYTFVDTGMGWWWDHTGTPPGGKPGEGCMRVINDGKRVYAGPAGEPGVVWPQGPHWRPGDDDITFDKNVDPCTEDNRKIDDTSEVGVP